MSATLGKIHYWLFDKIELLLQREQAVLRQAQEELGDLADELYLTAVDIYGAPLDTSQDLATLIDHDNIHGWLQKEIRTASIREAAFIKDLVDCGDDAGTEAVYRAFAQQGHACGIIARKMLSELTAPAIYQTMQNFYLNGMPCDGGDKILEETPGRITWDASFIHQRDAWDAVGLEPSLMKVAYYRWMVNFVSTVSTEATCDYDPTAATLSITVAPLCK